MAERSRHRASGGQDARSERPATGAGSPEPHARRLLECNSYQASVVVTREPHARSDYGRVASTGSSRIGMIDAVAGSPARACCHS